MKRRLISLGAAAALSLVVAGTAFAGKPTDPGCFGADRSAGVEANRGGATPGASSWGHEAANRAGTNGDLNQAWKTSCGGDPTP